MRIAFFLLITATPTLTTSTHLSLGYSSTTAAAYNPVVASILPFHNFDNDDPTASLSYRNDCYSARVTENYTLTSAEFDIVLVYLISLDLSLDDNVEGSFPFTNISTFPNSTLFDSTLFTFDEIGLSFNECGCCIIDPILAAVPRACGRLFICSTPAGVVVIAAEERHDADCVLVLESKQDLWFPNKNTTSFRIGCPAHHAIRDTVKTKLTEEHKLNSFSLPNSVLLWKFGSLFGDEEGLWNNFDGDPFAWCFKLLSGSIYACILGYTLYAFGGAVVLILGVYSFTSNLANNPLDNHGQIVDQNRNNEIDAVQVQIEGLWGDSTMWRMRIVSESKIIDARAEEEQFVEYLP